MSETQTTYERSITVLEDGPTGPFGGGNQGDPAQRTVGGYNATGQAVVESSIEEMTVKQLQAEAKSLGLTGLSKANQADLVKAIKEHYASQENANPSEDDGDSSGDGSQGDD